MPLAVEEATPTQAVKVGQQPRVGLQLGAEARRRLNAQKERKDRSDELGVLVGDIEKRARVAEPPDPGHPIGGRSARSR